MIVVDAVDLQSNYRNYSMSRTNDEGENQNGGEYTHLARIDEEVSKASLYDRPDPDVEAVHATAPFAESAVDSIWHRV